MSDTCSESSRSTFDNHNDIHSKYSRLAAEYSKIRAQNSVLKKAVIEEQAKTAELTDSLKDREQIIRKTTQEMESLTFRNMQLSRRIIVLQEEVETLQSHSKQKTAKKKGKGTDEIQNGSFSSYILDEDIKKIATENAKIVMSMQEKEAQYENEIFNLKAEVNRLDSEVEQHNDRLKQSAMEYKAATEDLKKENEDLKREIVLKSLKIRNTELELSTLKKAYAEYVETTYPKICLLENVAACHLPFIEYMDGNLNKLGVRSVVPKDDVVFSYDIKKNLEEVVTSISSIIQCIGVDSRVPKFGELYCSIEKLVEKNGAKLLTELKTCIGYIESISELCEIKDTELAVCHFLRMFLQIGLSFYLSYMTKIKKIQMPNEEEYERFLKFPLQNQITEFKVCKNDFYEKCMEDQSLPRTLLTEYFEQLDNSVNKLLAEVTEKSARIQDTLTSKEINLANRFRRRAAHYLCSIRVENVERVPYWRAIKNQNDLRDMMAAQNNLKEEIAVLRNQIIIAEEEKVHWMNEYNLLRVKEVDTERVFNHSPTRIQNDLGTLTSEYSLNTAVIDRESEIKKYFSSKVNEAIVEKQEALGKARTFIIECEMLQKRLEVCLLEKQSIENKLLESRKHVLEAQEELNIVSQNYESQLKMMSEHLANVNDKLSVQNDKIEELNSQLHGKSTSKSTFYVAGAK